MKKIFQDDVVVHINEASEMSWHSVLAAPEVDKRLSLNNDGGRGVVYVKCLDGAGKAIPIEQPHMKYPELKKFLRKQAKEREYMVFVTFDSFRDQEVVIMSTPMKSSRVFVVDVGKDRVFLGEQLRADIDDLSVVKECVSVEALVGERRYELIFPVGDERCDEVIKDLAEGMIVKVCGMIVSHITKRKSGGRMMVENQFSIVVNEYESVVDTYDDVQKVIPKLSSYDDVTVFRDVGSGKPLYPEILNIIMLFSVLYVRLGEPPFNVILSGIGGSGKTSCVKFLSKVFSKDGRIIASNMSTAKGLVPSYGDKPHVGMLIEPENFVKVVDEFFRRSEKEALSRGQRDPTPFVYNFLTEAMNVVERRPDVLAGSGKGQLPPGTYMKDSFLATDNLNPGVRIALSTAVIQDKAVMRRFTFLLLNNEESQGIRLATEHPSDAEIFGMIDVLCKKKGYSLALLKRYSRWFRKNVVKVKVNRVLCKKITEELIRELLADLLQIDTDSPVISQWVAELNIIPYYEAFVRCCTLSRAVFEEKAEIFPEVIVSMKDYYDAEQLFRRLFSDTFEVYKNGIVEAVTTSGRGIMRSGVGFSG